MKMLEIKKKALMMGVKPGKLNKANLIKNIQSAEGNEACFGSGNIQCPQLECCWRSDCLPD